MKAWVADDLGWIARVTAAGVPVGLLEIGREDHDVVVLGDAIHHTARQATLSDDDLYTLLVAFWTSHLRPVDWPPDAVAVARRCARELAARQRCDVGIIGLPRSASLRTARRAICVRTAAHPARLLAVLADRWQDVSAPRDA